eukprot:TRINITY_DN11086_c0_g1_i1.p1 TRINITY_DN11086_c0_g1~~TRINITY_DN11086_c0_g1_i1.p1  ORF type:complete len:330 (+),score=7.37 TRINITY_DN11086_c0_g1_i1:3-992(+)
MGNSFAPYAILLNQNNVVAVSREGKAALFLLNSEECHLTQLKTQNLGLDSIRGCNVGLSNSWSFQSGVEAILVDQTLHVQKKFNLSSFGPSAQGFLFSHVDESWKVLEKMTRFPELEFRLYYLSSPPTLCSWRNQGKRWIFRALSKKEACFLTVENNPEDYLLTPHIIRTISWHYASSSTLRTTRLFVDQHMSHAYDLNATSRVVLLDMGPTDAARTVRLFNRVTRKSYKFLRPSWLLPLSVMKKDLVAFDGFSTSLHVLNVSMCVIVVLSHFDGNNILRWGNDRIQFISATRVDQSRDFLVLVKSVTWQYLLYDANSRAFKEVRVNQL